LEDNLNATKLQLTSEEIALLEQFTRPAPLYPDWFTTTTLDSRVAEALK
jgi:hypothetical protein